MTGLWGRWLAVALVAIGLGLAGLERSACVAAEQQAAVWASGASVAADDMESELSVGSHETEPSALPRLTY
jgi:hypothetical protein